MKRITGCISACAVALGLSLALAPAAQPEQWLDYHSSDQARGYRWVEVSTNPPPNVALPKLRPYAHYGQWKNALDGGRWFVIDRTARTGIGDRIFFDRNGNGRLDDETPVAATVRDISNVAFPPIKLVFKGEDGPTAYHLIVQCYQFDADRVQLLVAAGGWYEGNVTIAGKKRRVQLLDNTVNGAFNDNGPGTYDCDRLVFLGARPEERAVGKYLEIDGELLRLEVARDGAFIRTEKAEGVSMGAVRVPEALARFEAVGPNGHFIRSPAKTEFTLPVGKYRVQAYRLDRKDAKGSAWSLNGSSFSTASDFEVTAAEPAELEVGGPIRPLLEAVQDRGQISFSLRLLGSMGETVDLLRGSDRPRAPQLVVASAAGSFRSTNTFEYG